jgi:YcxB-like protein
MLTASLCYVLVDLQDAPQLRKMTAKYRISEDDYVNAMKLYGKLTPLGAMVLAGMALLLVMIEVLGPRALQGVAAGGLAGGIIVALVGWYVISPIVGRRQYRKYKAIQEEFTVELFEDGIHIQTGESYSKIKWANIQKWRHNNDYILIYPMPRIYYVVPKSVSRDGFDMALLIAQLTQHVGKPR